MYTAPSLQKKAYLSHLLQQQQQNRSNFAPFHHLMARMQTQPCPLEIALDIGGLDLDLPGMLGVSDQRNARFLATSSPKIRPDADTLSHGSAGRQEENSDETNFGTSVDDNRFFAQYSVQGPKGKAHKNDPFPLKLYRILHEAEKNGDDDIISFSPSGLSVMIHQPDEFVKKIMPKHFTSNRMTTFQRQCNLYGFHRRMRGEDKGGFFHDKFIRGQRDLCMTITRKAQAFRVPPHLLDDSPSQSMTSVENREAHTVSLSPSRIESLPRNYSRLQWLGQDQSKDTSSFRSSILANSPGSSNLEFHNHQASILGAVQSTSQLLEMKRCILAAKQRAAMRQRLALSALQELMHHR